MSEKVREFVGKRQTEKMVLRFADCCNMGAVGTDDSNDYFVNYKEKKLTMQNLQLNQSKPAIHAGH